MTSPKRAVTPFRAPHEREGEDRAWEVVRTAYQERMPGRSRRSFRRPAAAVAVGLALLGALALTPAGATVGSLITRAVGIQHAAPRLVSLPAPGRLLVSGPSGTWIVAGDGSTRRLGRWTEASWSAHGHYLAVGGRDRLTAIDLRGRLQWTLARHDVRSASWYLPSGYRVTYLSGLDLRVVAGDGSGDHLLARLVAPVAPAWRPGHPYQLAYVTGGHRLTVRGADTGRQLWSVRAGISVDQLAWSADGRRLVALSPTMVRVYGAGGALVASLHLSPGAPAVDAAVSPNGNAVALVLGGSASEVAIADLHAPRLPLRRVLPGRGLQQVAWSPDGRWVVVTWPTADQWVFIRVQGSPRIAAVSRIGRQFSTDGGHQFPRLDGWCCTAQSGLG